MTEIFGSDSPQRTGPQREGPAITTHASAKHRESIIQRPSTKRVRRPGSKRQIRIIAWIFVAIGFAVGGAYLLLRPESDVFRVRDFATALVAIRTIQDDLQLGGTVRARTEATVRAPAVGVLASVDVDVGDWVNPGQVIAVLDSYDLESQYNSQLANLAQSSRTYENLLLLHEQSLLTSRRQRAILDEMLQEETEDLEEATALFRLGTITQNALEGAEAAVNEAEKALVEHDEDVDIAGRFHEVALEGAADNIETIRAGVANLEQQIVDTNITSTIEGQVIWTIDMIQAIGEKISEDTPILQIADTRDPFIETVIEEQHVSEIATGQKAVAIIMGSEFVGVIERIGLLAVTPVTGGAPEVELDIGVEAEEIEAIPGSTALVEIVVGMVPDALVLPRGSYLSTGNNTYLYKTDGTVATRIRATFGAVNEQFVEILSGVSEGDEIIISSYQNYIRLTE